jgi:antitoxin PrlF
MYHFRIPQEDRPMEATVAERGQITLPKAVRDALGLTKGSVLKVELEGSRIVLRKSVDDAISRARGRFKLDGFDSTDAAMQAVRGQGGGFAADDDGSASST